MFGFSATFLTCFTFLEHRNILSRISIAEKGLSRFPCPAALCNAVVLEKRKHVTDRADSMLHNLICWRIDASRMDIFGMVLDVCPPRLLVESRPTPLSLALEFCLCPEMIRLLLEKDIEKRSLLKCLDRREIPLYQAARMGANEQVLRVLIQQDYSKQSLRTHCSCS